MGIYRCKDIGSFFSLAGLTIGVLLATSGWVQSAEPLLSGAQINDLLAGHTAISTNKSQPFRQYFDPKGTTTYWPDNGPVEKGVWAVRGDQYCSRWPKSQWACYDMTGANDRITWIDKTGGRFPARLVKGRAEATQ